MAHHFGGLKWLPGTISRHHGPVTFEVKLENSRLWKHHTHQLKLQEQNHSIEEQNHSIEEQNHSIEEQNHSIEEQNHSIEEQNHSIEEQNHSIEPKGRLPSDSKMDYDPNIPLSLEELSPTPIIKASQSPLIP